MNTAVPSHDPMSDNVLRNLARVMYKMPTKRYLTYIRSPQWQRVRREYLASIDWWCEHCKKATAIQCHHWTYERLGHELPQDLYGVCVICHHKLHMMVMPEPANDNKQLELPIAG